MTAAINVMNVEKAYRDRDGKTLPVIRNLSVHIIGGEFVAITGPSGCGKSTLLNLLGCLDRPDGGQVQFDDQDVGAWPESRRAEFRNQRIGFVFQSFHLLPFLTVAQNIAMPFIYSRDRQPPDAQQIEALLASVGISGLARRYPGQLSGGQQQRVAIARALVMGADVLLADEPTGNLDTAMAQDVLGLFEQLVQQGKTVILVTHDPAVAGRAKRQIRLLEGRIAFDTRLGDPS